MKLITEETLKKEKTTVSITKWKKTKAKELNLNLSQICDAAIELAINNYSDMELERKLDEERQILETAKNNIKMFESQLEKQDENNYDSDKIKDKAWLELWVESIKEGYPKQATLESASEILKISEEKLLDIIDELKLSNIDITLAQDYSYLIKNNII